MKQCLTIGSFIVTGELECFADTVLDLDLDLPQS